LRGCGKGHNAARRTGISAIVVASLLFVGAPVAFATNPPQISSFAPASGVVGTTVTVTGTGFTGATAVTFNSVSSPFSVDSDTQITTSVPDGATSGPIKVTTSVGTAQSSTSFSLLPSITSFSPASGAPGDTVTILGFGFSSVKSVSIGCCRGAYVVVDYHTIRATVATNSTTGQIKVDTRSGSALSVGTFTVNTLPPPPPTSYACARALGFSQTGQWYRHGNFENYVPRDNWEGQTDGGGNIAQWADPNSTYWNAKIYSPCKFHPLERVMLNIGYSLNRDGLVDNIYAAIQNIRDKYPTVRQIVLQAVIGGPDDTNICTFGGKNVDAAVQHPVVLDAIQQVLANSPWSGVVGGTDGRVQSCADFSDSSGHLYDPGAAYVAAELGHFYATLP